MNIKDTLTNLRKKNNLTQKQLGEKIGISDKVISKWESGQSIPKLDSLLKIADVYNISVDSILETKISKVFDKTNIKKSILFYCLECISAILIISSLILLIIGFIKYPDGIPQYSNGIFIKNFDMILGFVYMSIMTVIYFSFFLFFKIKFEIILVGKSFSATNYNRLLKNPNSILYLYKYIAEFISLLKLSIILNLAKTLIFASFKQLCPAYLMLLSPFILLAIIMLGYIFICVKANKFYKKEQIM